MNIFHVAPEDGLGGRPGMQDRGGYRVRRRLDKSRRVPTDQQPFNELQELKEDPLFGWAQEDLKVRYVTLPYVQSVCLRALHEPSVKRALGDVHVGAYIDGSCFRAAFKLTWKLANLDIWLCARIEKDQT